MMLSDLGPLIFTKQALSIDTEDYSTYIAVDTLVRTRTFLLGRFAAQQKRPSQSGDRYNSDAGQIKTRTKP